MSANRLSWVGVVVVVAVVGVLVARTVRQDDALKTGEPPTPAQTAARPATGAQPAADRVVEPGQPVKSGVQRAKEALQAKGYYKGPIDGNFDPTVIEALKRFQKDAGMRATGYLDQKTYAALGIEVKRRP
jgi:peptidoglycan hydrolase-like protein with peptidoglycan-binding domain